MWGHPHVTPSPIQSRFASQALLPLSNSPLHITAMLSLSFLSFSCRTPSLCSQLQTKCTFPITAPQQEYLCYQPCLPNLPTNQCRAGRTARILYIRPRFQPEIHYFNISIQQKTHLQELFKPTSGKPAAISRKTEQQQYQEGPVCSQHIKMDSQFLIRRSKLSVTTRRSDLSVTVQEGVTSFDIQHHDT